MIKKSYNFWKNSILIDKKSKFFICFIVVGCLCCLGMGTNLSYINYIYYSIVHPYLISFFLIPTIFYYIYKLNNIIKKNNLCLNFSTKKKYLYFCIQNILIITVWWLFIFTFIILLLANMFSVRNFSITIDPNYNEITNLYGLFLNALKLNILTISYSLFFFSILQIHKKYKILFIFLLILSLFTMMGYVEFNGILALLLPYRYIGFVYVFNSFKKYLISSLIYCFILLLLSVLMFLFVNYRGDFK